MNKKFWKEKSWKLLSKQELTFLLWVKEKAATKKRQNSSNPYGAVAPSAIFICSQDLKAQR